MIGIVVPVYNVEKYLCRCIESILSQTVQDFELVLVNDGSIDNSSIITEKYILKSNKIVVFNKLNNGQSSARNHGMDYVLNNPNIRWLTFIDSDDWVHPNYIAHLYKACIENSQNISAARFLRTSSLEEKINNYLFVSSIYPPEIYWLMKNACPRIVCAKLYKKTLWKNIRFPVGKIFEDESEIYKILFAERSIAILDYELYFYYYNNESTTSGDWKTRYLHKLDALKSQRDFFKKNKYEKAYARAVGMYLFFLNDAVLHLKLIPNYSYWGKIKYKGKLALAVVAYLLFDRKLKIRVDDYAYTAFPICSAIVSYLRRLFGRNHL